MYFNILQINFYSILIEQFIILLFNSMIKITSMNKSHKNKLNECIIDMSFDNI